MATTTVGVSVTVTGAAAATEARQGGDLIT